MKTSAQVMAKFEEVVKGVEALAAEVSKLPKKQQGDNLPVDLQLKLAASLSSLFVLGWIMGCEEELKQFKVLMQMGALEGLLGGK